MAIKIEMPRLSDTMEEGTLNHWHVKVGDTVKAGDTLADIETDKATMALEAFDDGTVAHLVDEGATLAVGQVICILAEEGESVEDAAGDASADSGTGGKKKGASKKTDNKAEKPVRGEKGDKARKQKAADEDAESEDDGSAEGREEAAQAAGESKTTDQKSGDRTRPAEISPDAQEAKGASKRIRTSPLARRMAEEHDLDLGQIDGSGPGGRIVKRDVVAAIEGGRATRKGPAPARGGGQAEAATGAPGIEGKTIKLSGMRKTIARRLLESKTTIPHFTVTITVAMDSLMALRGQLNQQLEAIGIKLSVNDFIVRAAALSLLQHPVLNSSWSDDGIVQHGSVHVGVAVALPAERGGGLVVPVIRDADRISLKQISSQTRQLADKARSAGLSVEEMSDGTFTLSNLGMMGVDHFEAIINPPQAGILAIGAALERPVVRNGQIVVGHEMTLTLSADHRVVDGAQGAAYLQTLKQMLENPATLLV